jgi:hypothetical protein
LEDSLESSREELRRLDGLFEGAAMAARKLEAHIGGLRQEFVSKVSEGHVTGDAADLAFETAQKLLLVVKNESLAIEKLRLMKEGEAAALAAAVTLVKKKHDEIVESTMSQAERKLELSRTLSDVKSSGVAPSIRGLMGATR